MLKTETFTTRAEVINFLKTRNITFERIVLIIERLNSHELIYR